MGSRQGSPINSPTFRRVQIGSLLGVLIGSMQRGKGRQSSARMSIKRITDRIVREQMRGVRPPRTTTDNGSRSSRKVRDCRAPPPAKPRGIDRGWTGDHGGEGIDAATTQEIADRADVGAGTVYSYFKSSSKVWSRSR
jgi:hypothetical protein